MGLPLQATPFALHMVIWAIVNKKILISSALIIIFTLLRSYYITLKKEGEVTVWNCTSLGGDSL